MRFNKFLLHSVIPDHVCRKVLSYYGVTFPLKDGFILNGVDVENKNSVMEDVDVYIKRRISKPTYRNKIVVLKLIFDTYGYKVQVNNGVISITKKEEIPFLTYVSVPKIIKWD